MTWRSRRHMLYRCPACATVYLPPGPVVPEFGAEYFQRYYEAAAPARREYNRAVIVPFAGPLQGKRVLDIGAGLGYLLEEYAVDNTCAAVETSAYAREQMRVRLKIEPVATLAELPAEAGYDLICCIDALPYFADPAEFWELVPRRLAAGGRLILKLPARPRRWWRLTELPARLLALDGLFHLPAQVTHYSALAVANLAARHGLRVTRRLGVGDVPGGRYAASPGRDALARAWFAGWAALGYAESMLYELTAAAGG